MKSSYQKLKEINQELQSEIITLVKNKDFMKVEEIRMKYKFLIQAEEIVMFGNFSSK